MLGQLKVEFVKIDRSIVAGAPTDPAARAVLMAVAAYASQTGSLVIAEGIEDQDTLDFLGEIDTHDLVPGRIITAGQGYGLGRPAARLALEPPALLRHRPAPLTSA
jgi:EAL domain-containing protein (putative c-di-GMP-specific phosphodiesterase class I)